MKVSQFIKWLEKQPQNLEVCVIENRVTEESGAFGVEDVTYTDPVCFDDPSRQSTETKLCLILGVE
jgi:hypothetical protein